MATRIVSVETVLVYNLGGAQLAVQNRYIYNRRKHGYFMSKLVKMLL